MTNKITVNGAIIANPEDEALLRSLLSAFCASSDGNDEISVDEAFKLLDTDGNGTIDKEDLKTFFSKGYSFQNFNRIYQIFSDLGITNASLAPKAPREMLAEMDLATLVQYADLFKGDYAASAIIQSQALDECSGILRSMGSYSDLPFGEEMIRYSALNCAGFAVTKLENFQDKPYLKDILEAALKENPGVLIRNFEKYKGIPGAIDILKRAVAASPTAFFKNFKLFKDSPLAEALVKIAFDSKPNVAVKYFRVYKEQPYAETLLRGLVERSPGSLVMHHDSYKKEAFAEEIFKLAAEKAPEAVLQNFKSFKNALYPYTTWVFAQTALRDRYEALESAHLYKDQPEVLKIIEESLEGYDEFAVSLLIGKNDENLIKLTAEALPELMMKNAPAWLATEFGPLIIKIILEKRPAAILRHFKWLKETPIAEVMLAMLFRDSEEFPVVNDLPEEFLKNFKQYGDLEFAKAKLRGISLTHTQAALEHIENFMDHPESLKAIEYAVTFNTGSLQEFLEKKKKGPNAEAAIMALAMGLPKLMLEAKDLWKDLPFADAVTESAMYSLATNDPETFFKGFETYGKLAYADALVRIAIKSSPEIAAKYFALYKHEPYAEAMARRIASKSPDTFIKNYQEFKEEPYAEEILRETSENSPMAALRNFGSYKDLPCAKAIFGAAVITMPAEALTQLDANLVKIALDSLDEEEVLQVAREFPELMLKNAQGWIDRPYAKRIIQIAMAQNADIVIKHFGAYSKHPDAAALLQEAAAISPIAFIKNFGEYQNEKIAIKILRKILPSYGETVLENSELFLRDPRFAETIEEAISRDPSNFRAFVGKLKEKYLRLEKQRKDPVYNWTAKEEAEKANIEERLMYLASHIPATIMHYADAFDGLPFANGIIGTARASAFIERYPPQQ